MRPALRMSLIAIAVLLLLAVSGTLYTLDENHQAIVLQFGRPVGEPVKTAGLHMKWPFIQEVRRFDKRILIWDGDPNQIPTKDKRYILVDSTARWKIVDALKFMQSVGTLEGGYARLDDVVDAATRDAVSGLN